MFPIDSNETKKLLSHMYNEVSKELFGFGTTLLKVTIEQNVITFQAKHRRASRSAALEGEVPALKLEVDFHMSLLYKKKLRQKLEEQTDWEIEAVLRDYDGATQRAFTNIVLKEQ
ncbi:MULTISPECIES: DUF2294 domain-containing protein [Metabacillus]|jgi:hypothetical protein|uniref:DUF2294 domain-containing protein n=1 Tax=Metabacillus rhizolycopersici TaxID=2875709 RepID=A0ABS7UP48_9BACI|nr:MULTISPECIES: DUF2294 domain-containing protein [Metabacillus]MBZ5750067.1 DUF2294 domain-containing protein [Metabacillus rhizolycopersici]MCM3653146.1 DUF2294 domain-containing protein [Metabacillus litoralis]